MSRTDIILLRICGYIVGISLVTVITTAAIMVVREALNAPLCAQLKFK